MPVVWNYNEDGEPIAQVLNNPRIKGLDAQTKWFPPHYYDIGPEQVLTNDAGKKDYLNAKTLKEALFRKPESQFTYDDFVEYKTEESADDYKETKYKDVIISLIGELQDHLKPFEYDLTRMTSAGFLGRKRKQLTEAESDEKYADGHNPFDVSRRTRSFKLYCSRCFNNETEETLCLCVVAECTHHRHNETRVIGERQVKGYTASLTVNKIFPHNRDCAVEECFRPSYIVDREAATGSGSGVLKGKFPLRAIFEGVYDPLIKKMNDEHKNPEHPPPGLRIQNYCKVGNEDYLYDIRNYEYLPHSSEFYSSVLKPNAHLRAMRRAALWTANMFNAADDFASFQHETHKLAAGKGDRYLPTFPMVQGRREPSHFLSDAIILYNGYEKRNQQPTLAARTRSRTPNDVVHQPWHYDIAPLQSRTEGEIHVSNNPKLQGRLKPGAIIIPLHDKRDLGIIVDKMPTDVTISKGEFMYVAGDTVHQGKTTPLPIGPDSHKSANWHACLHIYLETKLHPRDKDAFSIDKQALALHAPVHLPWMDDASQVDMLKYLFENTTDALSAIVDGTSSKPCKRVVAATEKFIENFSSLLQPTPPTSAKKRGKSPENKQKGSGSKQGGSGGKEGGRKPKQRRTVESVKQLMEPHKKNESDSDSSSDSDSE